jgi:hypothetical protein
LCFIAATVDLAMVSPAEWHGEFVADLPTKRPRLNVAQMVRVRRAPAADKARLGGDESDMLAVSNTPWLREGENGFIDRFGARAPASPCRGSRFASAAWRRDARSRVPIEIAVRFGGTIVD